MVPEIKDENKTFSEIFYKTASLSGGIIFVNLSLLSSNSEEQLFFFMIEESQYISMKKVV